MLKTTNDYLAKEVLIWMRGFIVLMAGLFASVPIVIPFLPPSQVAFPIPTSLLSIGCVLVSLFLFSHTGKNRLDLDFVRGRYAVVAGWPFLEKYSQGVIVEDIESIDIEGNLLYVRWKKAKHAKFYMGMTTSYNCDDLAHKMNVPLTTNHPASINGNDATLLRASQRVDRDLLQSSETHSCVSRDAHRNVDTDFVETNRRSAIIWHNTDWSIWQVKQQNSLRQNDTNSTYHRSSRRPIEQNNQCRNSPP